MEKLFKYPWLIIIIIGMVTVFFAIQLPRAELDNNNIRFIPEDDESRLINEYIDDTFGSSFFILVALEREQGDVFEISFLNRIREFNVRMEDFAITGSINSIVSSDYIFSHDDAIIVEKLLGDDFTGREDEIAALRERILSWDIYRNALVSDDFKATQILIPLEIDSEQASRPEVIESFLQIRDVAKEMFGDYGEVYVTGLPVISAVINEAMRADLIIMIPLVIIVVLLMLFFSFRKFSHLILPLLSVLTAVIWSVGAMPLFGIKLSIVSTVLPVILVAVGSAYGIHFITHYLADVDSLENLSWEEHRLRTLGVSKKIVKSVFLAALTTMAGFSSFCFTSVIPVREFGFFSTFGVLVSFLVASTLIPSILIIRGPKKSGEVRREEKEKTTPLDYRIAGFFTALAGKRTAIIIVIVLVVLVSIFGITRLEIDNIFVEYFKDTSDIARSDRFIRERFGGSKIVSVVVEADSTEALLMPDVLGALDGLAFHLENNVQEAGKVMGFTDLVKRMNQVFNAGESPHGLAPRLSQDMGGNFGFGFDDFGFDDFGFDDFGFDDFDFDDIDLIHANYDEPEEEREIDHLGITYYEIPQDPQRYGMSRPEELSHLVSNYLVLLSANISEYANHPLSPTSIKTTIQLRTVGNIDTQRGVDQIRDYIDQHFPQSVDIIIGGSALVEASLNRLVVESQIISVILSIVIVFIIITMSNRSLIAGLIGIAPLSVCILINFAIMGITGIKLNIGTSMMASLCVGIGIDYSIHYLEAYKREYPAGGNILFRTFASSGKAIIINALSVGAGFAVLILSQFVMLKDLGLLITLTMASSSLVCLTLLPILLTMIKPKFIVKEN